MFHKSFYTSLVTMATVSASFPPIEVTVDGVPTTLYVQYPETWSSATVSGDSVSFDFKNRLYLSESPTTDPSQYFTPQMLGGYLEYDVDLSGVGCGCVTAFYGVLMPGLDNANDPFQYCGAGNWAANNAAACPEFDIMEANMWGFRGTSHGCPPPDANGFYADCDAGSNCSVDVLENDTEADYGPGPDYSIDTT